MFEISVIEKNYDMNDPDEKPAFITKRRKGCWNLIRSWSAKIISKRFARTYGIAFDDLNRLVNRLGLKAGYGDENIYQKKEPGSCP